MTDSYGIKMSKPGVDVQTAGEKDLSFSSGSDSLLEVASGEIYLAINGTSATSSLSHGIGYRPQFFVMLDTILPLYETYITWDYPGGVLIQADASISSTTLTVAVECATSITTNISFHYVLFNKAI